jgi:hypothetical protein
MTHDGIGEQLSKDEKEIPADDILRSVVEICGVNLRGNLDKTPFLLHF